MAFGETDKGTFQHNAVPRKTEQPPNGNRHVMCENIKERRNRHTPEGDVADYRLVAINGQFPQQVRRHECDSEDDNVLIWSELAQGHYYSVGKWGAV